MPKSNAEEEEIKEIHEELDTLTDMFKGEENFTILGRWSVVMGEDGKIIDKFSLRKRMLEFCYKHNSNC